MDQNRIVKLFINSNYKSIIGYWNSVKRGNVGKETNQTDLS